MYVRQPPGNSSRVKLPDNYSGNAFSRTPYSDMPPPARQSVPQGDYLPPPAANEHPRADVPQKSSPLAEQLRESIYSPPPPDLPDVEKHEYQEPPRHVQDITEDDAPVHGDASSQKDDGQKPREGTSIFSSLLPRGFSKNGFPFGHGIGGEELLILGMMLLVYLSGEERGDTDNELIVLLGLLLFAG